MVYSRKDKGLKYSIRSINGLDAGRITAKALAGLGSGGGHQIMAGGFVPFTGTDSQLQTLVEIIKTNFLHEVSLNSENITSKSI